MIKKNLGPFINMSEKTENFVGFFENIFKKYFLIFICQTKSTSYAF